jgi:anthraniloyl-CoA monooxygenase
MGESRRIVCVGGGPASLFLAILVKSREPDTDIVVLERNRLGDTFGFGVVFSDETLSNIAGADAASITAIEDRFRYWGEMDIRFKGRTLSTEGHGFAALERKVLLEILTARAIELGIDVRFECDVTSLDEYRDADLIVGGDGLNSTVRSELIEHFEPTLPASPAKYIWTATEARFDRFTFIFEPTDHGWVQAHIYPFDDQRSTFIVEMAESTWEAWELGGHDDDLAVGESDQHGIEWCENVFADHLGGQALIGNNSRWLNFRRVNCGRWYHENVVLLGDAVHTAHYSIGSGTKLALEDAAALADALGAQPDVASALAAYESGRRAETESLQRAAATSEEWFQQVDHHAALEPEQFTFSLLTRSMRVTHDNLEERDPAFVAATRRWFHESRPEAHRPVDADILPIFYPYALRDLSLHNRIVVSPMAQYSATDGTPGDWHLVHLGSRAVGGAGLVMTEMTCVSPEGRITPGCTGLWNDEQTQAWRRIVDFVHENSEAKIALQVGHAGRKGATQLAWEEMDAPLAEGAWPLVSASPLPYRPDSQVPQEMSAADMEAVLADFVATTERAADAGFDMIEVHAAHGYLLSSFLSPVTNQRTDEFGGSLENRARYPLAVIDAVRVAWPDSKPMAVRISATDWVEGGFDRNDAVAFARMLKEHDVDIIDVSTGQVDQAEEPAFGRLYQTPFSEVIRNSVDIPTMAVGAISSVDDINTVLLSGRADLCMLARAHLVDPYWSLNAAIDVGQGDQPWPKQYNPGRTSRRREQSPTALIDRDLR